ncbi:MAG: DUF1549 domain-containing protein [Verrucomicrobia bacterium]|nr:DUF1549 domain-containing protein [Verrucomicrobiota bacterium]
MGLRIVSSLFSFGTFVFHTLTCLAIEPDFEIDIAPILEASCLSCHNQEDAEGDLVLETRSLALEHPDAIIPGRAAESYLVDMISGTTPDMPEEGDPLTSDQVKLLRAWIDAGAEWPEDRVLVDNRPRDLDWWSLKPIVRPQVPQSDASHPIDAFINAKLTEKNLTPAGQADPVTLIRRLTYDLTGLPPSPEEVGAFVDEFHGASSASARDAVWQNRVDQLLASPEFGEKWAQHWLDLARFAETHGYDKDKLRPNAWHYRDYVIRSFNEDKPYKQFVQEQVAGDVLYPGQPDGVIGLGFLAAGPWDFVGHWEVGEDKLDGRIAKHLDRDEMISAVFNVFQSTTVQCAQCHHHKFDPIMMEDYYRLHAVFAAVDRTDRIFEGLTTEQLEERKVIVRKINDLRVEQDQITTQLDREVNARVSGLERRIAEIKETYGSGQEPRYGYHSLMAASPDTEKWLQVDLGKSIEPTQIYLIPAYDKANGIGAGYGFPLRYRVEGSNDPEFNEGVRRIWNAMGEDQPNPGSRTVSMDVGAPAIRYIRMTATRLANYKTSYLFALGELQAVNAIGNQNFALNKLVTASDSMEQEEHWRAANLVDGIYFRALSDGAPFEELERLTAEKERILAEMRSPEIEARKEEIIAELEVLQEELKPLNSDSVVYAANTNWVSGGRFMSTNGDPRPIHLLHRGDLTSPGQAMTPGALPLWDGVSETFFDTDEWKEGEARAELARYLTRMDNPLIWRSIANRLWQWTFGKPLAGSPNDFGRMGMLPTHPELLEYLAARMRDDPKQSIKSMVRFLVTSQTYRRSSEYDASNATIDGSNQYWWRADRRRLTAEEFRDSLLAVSGALKLEERGGPSFYDFVIEKPQHSPHYEYYLHDPDDPQSHRRSVYRFVVRSQPQPMLTTLDCADPSISVPVRDESTSALQALTQWNHVLVEAMSRRLSQRLSDEGLETPDALVERASLLALGRPPNPMERDLLGSHFQEYGSASMARVLFNLNDFTYLD